MAAREVASLQRNLGELEHVRRQLSEFFCEDINSFKLEECFRIFHGFYCKFKQAVSENERRRLQEEQANERRRQREELLATKRRQMGNMAGSPDSDSFSIDMQIYDTRSCFPMKKGRKTGNGSVVSEDETSFLGSPTLSRHRLGSFNGSGADTSAGGKEEKSPDITPNGSLRRRRSRVLSEDDEGNLMDFLRASDNNRERKSWGSLDRSWARKARGSGSRKRPALLSADFSSERERPSSPSPLTENKPIVSAPEEETKPKEWRQKIESWLQANESDNASEEQRRQTRKVTNRRSLEMDSESERSSTLDTLPEGKQVHSGGQSSHRKAYTAWNPSSTIESTDVVSAMEAVEDIQPIKDKSAWRKSNLNVSNTSEETKEDNYLGRHSRSHQTDNLLHSIDEDKALDRKGLISSLGERMPTDRLTLYIRKPTDVMEPGEKNPSLGNAPRRSKDSQHSLDCAGSNDKAEIDQDNIETPPATRKIFIPSAVDKREPLMPSLCSRKTGRTNSNRESPALSPEEPEENSILGDGQFDRYSAARRTRRYKRNQENSEVVSPTESVLAETIVLKSPTQLELSQPTDIESEIDKETRLKAWQEKLKTQNVSETKTGRRYRNQTGIKPSDVEMALNLRKDKSNISSTYITPEPIKATSNKIDIPSRKIKEHDNDEGFEETQSLMSESPSQGASSGGNCETDIIDSAQIVIANSVKPKPIRLSSAESKGTINTVANSDAVSESRISSRNTRLHSAPNVMSTRTVERIPSLRKPSQDVASSRKSVIPRRSDSIKKVASKTSITPTKPISIQKSNSRNSIVSSRSSLNSATSTSTVKKLPLRPNTSSNLARPVQRTPSSKADAAASRNNLKRTSSTSSNISTRPPRPQALSFMKPTAASSTKSSQPAGSSRITSFKAKN